MRPTPNRQTEADPSAFTALMDDVAPGFAASMVSVAGDRVTTDPVAVPFSKGRNLLCIYSKRHMNNPPELASKKKMHNARTMGALQKLLQTGGRCIWVAPSGGRDRPPPENPDAPFKARRSLARSLARLSSREVARASEGRVATLRDLARSRRARPTSTAANHHRAAASRVIRLPPRATRADGTDLVVLPIDSLAISARSRGLALHRARAPTAGDRRWRRSIPSRSRCSA